VSENSTIEWTDHTFNPWEGCQKVGPGCDHCYAEARNTRFSGGVAANWGPGAPRRRTSATNWRKPITWNAAHEAFLAEHGRRQRVFCASLADVFDNAVDPAWRADLFDLIENTPNLDWLLLTKRIGNVTPMITETAQRRFDLECILDPKLPPNVWLGATIVNQEEADRDIPKLLAAPAQGHFLSMEPLLGPVDIEEFLTFEYPHCDGFMPSSRYKDGYCDACAGHKDDPIHVAPLGKVDWVIVGGESGPGARPMLPDWARSLRDQCERAGTPYLFKQWGEWHTASVRVRTGEPVFRQFGTHRQWVNKASTWVNGGVCLDRNGIELQRGEDFARAHDEKTFPVTIMHRVGKKTAGRLLDGRAHDDFPNSPIGTTQRCATSGQ
jgi:protein gp37